MEKMKFEEINISEELRQGISKMGFEEMSPIQSQAIPIILAGKDIIGQAQTGTGKTAAFGIPILEMVDTSNKNVQALVLCPTRELSIQVAEEIGKLGKFKKGLSILPIYGGQPIDRQIKTLKKGVQIVIGTPGRVMDHMRRKTLKLDNVNMMVLDEADEMFDMGFREDMAFVMDGLKEDRQTIFFSATMPKAIVNFATKYQNQPEIVKVVHKELTVPKVEQSYFELKSHMKTETLCRLMDIHNPQLTVVFCNTKRKVDELIEELQNRGYFADGLHGDLKQNQRDNVMAKFRKGTIDILVATDVAARGIDVDEVDMVINYDMPQDEEYYVHRIGRTARAGREGKAFSFVVGRDLYKLRDIQRYTKTKIERQDIPTLKDIESNYTTNVIEKIKAEIEKGDLGKYEKIVETMMTEDYTSFNIAAALLKFHMSSDKLNGHKEIENVDTPGSGRNRDRNRDRDRKPAKRDNLRGDKARLYMNIGTRKGASQRHILAGIIEYTNIDKNNVGNIDVYDKFSFVEVPKDMAKDIVSKMNGQRVKGTKVTVEVANVKKK